MAIFDGLFHGLFHPPTLQLMKFREIHGLFHQLLVYFMVYFSHGLFEISMA